MHVQYINPMQNIYVHVIGTAWLLVKSSYANELCKYSAICMNIIIHIYIMFRIAPASAQW